MEVFAETKACDHNDRLKNVSRYVTNTQRMLLTLRVITCTDIYILLENRSIEIL